MVSAPIEAAFLDSNHQPGWTGDDSSLRIHDPSVRGYWPILHGIGT